LSHRWVRCSRVQSVSRALEIKGNVDCR
jgi:hypothetical protein